MDFRVGRATNGVGRKGYVLEEPRASTVGALERRLAEVEARLEKAEGSSAWRSRLRYALLWASVFALTVTGVATGVTGANLREGVRNPASGFASAETQLVSNNGTGYTARLSNFNVGDGGAQASGCRSSAANEPCLQLANLGGGRAFDIFSNSAEVGRITANGASPATAKPFTTNAGGVATGLNADKVDGKNAADLVSVLGSGALDDPCISDTNCPLVRNRNVTSVTRADYGEYCIAVAGADPANNLIVAGHSLGSVEHFVQTVNENTISCPPDEFMVVTYGVDESGEPELANNVSFWFAVLP